MAAVVEWIRNADSFAALESEWDALLPEDPHPFDLHCWYVAWWEAFGGDSQLSVCTVRRDGELVGALPLRRDGRRLRGLGNDHTPLTRPLAADGEALQKLAAAVAEAKPASLELLSLPDGDPTLTALERACLEGSMLPVVEPSHASPFVDTRGDYETWRKENKHRWKAPLERKWRKMEREFESDFTMIEAPKNLEAELSEGLRIEASGWKGEGGTAIESAPETAAFYRLMTKAFHERDELRFNWIVLDGKAVSFDMCLLYRNRLYTLKSGYDEDYRNLAPGFVLRLAVIKRCFEDGIDEHDLLGAEIGWKTRFASGNRPHVNLRAYRKSPFGYARRGYRHRLRPSLKTAYRRLRPVNG